MTSPAAFDYLQSEAAVAHFFNNRGLNMYQAKVGDSVLSRRIDSLRCAVAGIGHLLRTQVHARVHAAATMAVVAAGIAFRVDGRGWCWLIAAMGAVWAAEGFNTAVELLADAICLEHHPLLGRAKDVAAGAVLIASIAAAGIGLCVFGARL